MRAILWRVRFKTRQHNAILSISGDCMYAKSLFRLTALVGLSQSDVARHLGLSRQTVSDWAVGRAPIPDEHFEFMKPLLLRTVTEALAPPATGRAQLSEQFSRRNPRVQLAVEILQCLEDLQAEQAPGGPMALVHSACLVLQDLTLMDPGTRERLLQKAAERQKYAAAVAQMQAGLEVLGRLVPLEEQLTAYVKGSAHGNDDENASVEHPEGDE
jgi:hypothetical protein